MKAMLLRSLAWVLVVAPCLLLTKAEGADGWFAAVGKDTIVCVSPKAEASVRQAAERVVSELKKVQPDATLYDPEKLVREYEILGRHHVIVVGQWADNIILRATWGYWASTKAQREWQAKGDDLAREYMALWERDVPPLEWRWKHDFFAFGYGDFDGAGVGYVQTVRNPYTILLRSVPGQKAGDPVGDPVGGPAAVIRPKDAFPANQMYFIVHLTGTGPQGVAKAADAFLANGLLNGVTGEGENGIPSDWTLERLGKNQLLTDIPPWAPIANLPQGVQYLGQQMPGSHLYGKFMQATGVHPVRCWRLKYRVPSGFVLYDSYPTNRASGNELFIAQMASAEDAQKAAGAMANKTDSAGRSMKERVAARDKYVVVHSFWMPEGAELMKQAVTK